MIKVELERQTLRYPVPEPAHVNFNHIPHCFDYIRQGLMCSADTTLEFAKMDEHGQRIRNVDGWGAEHQCRDWDAILKWSEDHRTDNSKAIIPDWFALKAGFKKWGPEDEEAAAMAGGHNHHD
jgi:hypothetical protein